MASRLLADFANGVTPSNYVMGIRRCQRCFQHREPHHYTMNANHWLSLATGKNDGMQMQIQGNMRDDTIDYGRKSVSYL